jgi:hypothetical protein
MGVAPSAVGGMERDSPRSVVLTLCGAWGALKAPVDGDSPVDATEVVEKGGIVSAGSPEATPLSRSELLGFRKVLKGEKRPPGSLHAVKARKAR